MPDSFVVLDVRELPAPEPLQKALLTLQELPETTGLLLIHRKLPQPLIELVTKQGYATEVEEPEEGLYHIRIWRVSP
ncbi:MAG: DUF2249 domain-containing protein [Campylobacterales bacterium]